MYKFMFCHVTNMEDPILGVPYIKLNVIHNVGSVNLFRNKEAENVCWSRFVSL